MSLLTQFLLRLSFGLAAGMAITSPKQVTSGYFRNHLYVTLGLTAFAALLSRSAAPNAFWFAAVAAFVSYVGSVCWLYESRRLGQFMLVVVAGAALLGLFGQLDSQDSQETVKALYGGAKYEAFLQTAFGDPGSDQLFYGRMFWRQAAEYSRAIANVTSGLLLGMTMAAMLLGHWYLNSPTMELMPLKRLIIAMGCAVALQAVVSSLGLWLELGSVSHVTTQWVLFVALRWLFGIVGVAVLAWMAWETLKIPNTQSATGILYVAVIGTFVGETMALLLSRESLFPL